MKIKNLSISFLILTTLIVLAACGSSDKNVQMSSSAAEAAASLGSVNRFAGVVAASGETKIEKDASKSIASINVSVGDSVTAGQVLFTYDGTQAQQNYEKAAIELEQLRLTLQSQYDQRAQLETEKAAATAEEQLSYTLEIQELDTTIRETSYNITQKEKEVENLASGLNQLEVKAPSDGKVQSINAASAASDDEMGAFPASSSQPFMVLVKTNTYRVKAYINELNAGEIQVGMPVIIRSRTDNKTWTGKVTAIEYGNPEDTQSEDSEGGSSDVSTSSKYPFFADLDSSEGLMLGQHVFVEPAQSSTTEGASE